MNTGVLPSRGILTAAGSFVESVISLAKNRVELFSLELQEEKVRLIQMIIWIAGAVFAGVMALGFASFAIVYAFWASSPLQALLAITGFYVILLGFVIWRLKRCIVGQPKPFSSTIAEFEKDRACIQPTS